MHTRGVASDAADKLPSAVPRPHLGARTPCRASTFGSSLAFSPGFACCGVHNPTLDGAGKMLALRHVQPSLSGIPLPLHSGTRNDPICARTGDMSILTSAKKTLLSGAQQYYSPREWLFTQFPIGCPWKWLQGPS